MNYKNLIISILILSTFCIANAYEPRVNFSQMLEPFDIILHGAGQDPGQNGGVGTEGFHHYWDVMDDDEKPIVFMTYENLFNIGSNWASSLKSKLIQYQDTMIVIQMGLQLVGSTEYIPNGDLDDDIQNLLDGIEELGLPVYLRIGYEFNGRDWNRYEPESYKASFIYITEKIRESQLEIATVWNFVPDVTQDLNFMNYYPGDEYVDWWSINFFNTYQISHASAIAYLDSAILHQKPVLIGESTPKNVGVTDGQADWDEWFEPFFNLVANRPVIKMTGYINWNWSEFSQWADWGDARLEQNETVLNHFRNEMDDTIYHHASSEAAFRKLLGYDELISPSMVSNIVVQDSVHPASISWDPSDDASGIARYVLYNNSEFYNFTGKNEFVFSEDLNSNDTLNISILPVDRAGNMGEVSNAVQLVIPEFNVDTLENNSLVNGKFDQGKEGWELWYGAAGVEGIFEIDTTGLIEGKNSAHIQITKNTSTNWHIQLQQSMKVKKDHRYAIRYQAKARENTRIETWLQKANSPYTGYAQRNITLTAEVQTFRDTAYVTRDDNVFMRFMFGTSGLAEMWFDDISVIEIEPEVGVDKRGIIASCEFNLLPPYPNPFNPITQIEYSIMKSSQVMINIFNINGQFVECLIDEKQNSGHYQLQWDAGKCSSGIYLIKLLTQYGFCHQKVLLIK